MAGYVSPRLGIRFRPGKGPDNLTILRPDGERFKTFQEVDEERLEAKMAARRGRPPGRGDRPPGRGDRRHARGAAGPTRPRSARRGMRRSCERRALNRIEATTASIRPQRGHDGADRQGSASRFDLATRTLENDCACNAALLIGNNRGIHRDCVRPRAGNARSAEEIKIDDPREKPWFIGREYVVFLGKRGNDDRP